MARTDTLDRRETGDKKTANKPDALETRYGAIGCAAVKAASLLSRRDDGLKSKGFASQTKRKP
ncbi:hypothetical protein [Pararhizobium haloflavum]|uniref:hypothetical protein n=1 Tax=Pararhizobium haloflavum TaxID=2037914 RepID=UPI000C18B611|nr:hypothetical protein [Pararhizobium haloflavum]